MTHRRRPVFDVVFQCFNPRKDPLRLKGTMTLSLLLGLLLAPSVLAADTLGPQLRAQVEKARPNLGDLPAWQEEIFSSEVLSSSGRFIRDYKTSGTQVTKADVDIEGIKRYLSFTASQILKPDARRK